MCDSNSLLLLEFEEAKSVNETYKHREKVNELINQFVGQLLMRGLNHDRSKIENDTERAGFAVYTSKLKGLTYGSDEYKETLKEMQEFIDLHYAANRHHPEHFKTGIKEMNLVDVVEMLCDWYAASQRHTNGDVLKSIELNQSRFGYGDELKGLMVNTMTNVFNVNPNKKLTNVRLPLPNGSFMYGNEITQLISDHAELFEGQRILMDVPYSNNAGGFSSVVCRDGNVSETIAYINFNELGYITGIDLFLTVCNLSLEPSELNKFIGFNIGTLPT